MSTHDKFRGFCASIQIDSTSAASISYRYKRITRQLNRSFYSADSELSNSLYVGSYGRDTDIHVSDIDMLFVLPYEKYVQYRNHQGNGQSALLQEVKSSIQNTYKSNMRADGQVVGVSFTDGVIFEVVPCFLNKDKSYTYPNTSSGGNWKTTNPKPEIAEIKSSNQAWNQNLKRLCRMARSWKDTWNVPMGGLLIDTLCYNFLSGWNNKDKSYTYYDWMTRDFFEYLKDQNTSQTFWYAVGSNQKMFRNGPFEYKALQCHNIALEAIHYESQGQNHSANKLWRRIYGTKFTT